MATLKITYNRRELTFADLEDGDLTDLVRGVQKAFASDRGVWLNMENQVHWIPESAGILAEYDGEPPKELMTLAL